MSTPFDVAPENRSKVSAYVRVVCGAFTAFSVWQVYWLYRSASIVEAAIPRIQSVGWWVVVWSIVGVAGLVAALSGRDIAARMCFAAMSVASVAGAVTIATSTVPMGREFYAFGEATLLAISSLTMLLSPLRPVPATDAFFDLTEVLRFDEDHHLHIGRPSRQRSGG